MHLGAPDSSSRSLLTKSLACDLVVVGGGLSGTCAAITAARSGLKVTLVQDRPVLGGNASSEVRLWILGATSHMGNNNRWAREGGVINELLVENLYRNPEGNPLILDAILLEMVANEPNITLLLNAAVHDVEKSAPDTVKLARAFCSQNSTLYEISAPLFCDASGDGTLGFLAGAAFRIGTEGRSEFDEQFAPEKATTELLGHSIYFYSKDVGRPVKFVPPSFALKDITRVPRYRDFKADEYGCRLWWIEWGGQLDTVHDTEYIKWELWKVAYGVWDYVKNSGRFPEAETLTLEWIGTVPGKRESRRFEGDYMISQSDLVNQRMHADAVSFGGWAIDLHPGEGVFSEKPGCQQWHAKGVYPIPYRSLYSRNITNLFLAGRIISATHIAFGSTRVMATCAHSAQAVGVAAALCREDNLKPRDLLEPRRMKELQLKLLQAGQYIPGLALNDPQDLARHAKLAASSELALSELRPNGETLPLQNAWAMMLPVQPGPMPSVTFLVDVQEATTLRAELRVSCKRENHTPDLTLATLEIPLKAGAAQQVPLRFDAAIEYPCYAFVCLMENPALSMHLSEQRVTGVIAVTQKFNGAVAKSPRQQPPPNSGLEEMEFWLPQRRPGGKNLALAVEPPISLFGVANLINGHARPTNQPNAWVASFDDKQPEIALTWETPQTISRIELTFDTDWDHPMESVLMGHPERVVPFCVQEVEILDGSNVPAVESKPACLDSGSPGRTEEGAPSQVVATINDNHQTLCAVKLSSPLTTRRILLRLAAPADSVPAALFEFRCYEH